MPEYITGVKIDFNYTSSTALNKIRTLLADSGCHYICTTNSEFVMEAQKDNSFKEIINSADLSLPDGIGTCYASVFLNDVAKFKRDAFFPLKALTQGILLPIKVLFGNTKLPDRLAGSDLTYDLCALAEQAGYTIFLLGGRKLDKKGKFIPNSSIGIETTSVLKKLYPKLRIIGYADHLSHSIEDDDSTLQHIKECLKMNNTDKLDILLVAYGQNKQEKWIHRNACKVPATLAMGVGGTFNFIVNNAKRSPVIWRQLHLEWLYRLFQEPWRIGRIFMAFPVFPLYIFLKSLKNK